MLVLRLTKRNCAYITKLFKDEFLLFRIMLIILRDSSWFLSILSQMVLQNHPSLQSKMK